MIDLDDLKTLREWQSRNRHSLYVYGGAFVFVLLITNLYVIWSAK